MDQALKFKARKQEKKGDEKREKNKKWLREVQGMIE